MKTISPKPIMTRVVQSWRIPPGMVFAVAEDAERRIWIVESTPVGTRCWTVEQAAELPQGARTGRALREAIRLGCRLQEERAGTIAAAELVLPEMLPRLPDEVDEPVRERMGRPKRRRISKEPACL